MSDMNNEQIKSMVNYHKVRAKYHATMISEVQNICPHDDVDAKYGANTGNWDRGDDSYWVTVDCKICGKHFSVDSQENRKEYSKWGDRVVR